MRGERSKELRVMDETRKPEKKYAESVDGCSGAS